MNRYTVTQSAIRGISSHPYLFTFGVCLLIDMLFVNTPKEINGNAMLAESVVLIVSIAAAALGIYNTIRRSGGWNNRYKLTNFNSFLIMITGFFLKLCYISVTSITTRQHDVNLFGEGTGHAGYIEYLLYNHKLLDSDVRDRWQFYHPPLHHTISAVWIYIKENIFMTDHDIARESLQTLTLFYSMCIIISAYRILRHFRLEGAALYIPLIVISFHPAFIIFSGSINNDALSAAFIMGAIISALKWYDKQTMKGILKIALCIGLGMMTKISAAAAAPSVALMFLIVFIKKIKTDWKKLICQFICFGLVCMPLGLWFGIRNYIKWDIPLTYVQELDKSFFEYLGDQSFISRATDFSPHQLESVYVQLEYFDKNESAHGYNEYNPLITLMKSSVLDDVINENDFSEDSYLYTVSFLLFWSNVFIACFAFLSMIVMCFKKCSARLTEKLFFVSLFVVIMVSFYKMSADYPFTCTMNFRYITPTVIVGAVFMGLASERIIARNKLLDKVFMTVLGSVVCIFAMCSRIFYIMI